MAEALYAATPHTQFVSLDVLQRVMIPRRQVPWDMPTMLGAAFLRAKLNLFGGTDVPFA